MKIPNTMKAACVHKQGDSRIVVEDVPTPEPGPGQILIRVDSAGVNFSDVKRRRGDAYPFETRFPFTPGGEVAGTVVAHGSGVENPPIGSEVFALSGADGTGGYAQFTLSYASTAVPKPNGMSFELASVLVVAGSTAKLLLSKTAKLAPGESVLIPAATGGVGSFLVQLARRMDAGRILAAVGDTAKRARALELGAHEVVDYSSPEWPERVRELTDDKGVDVALEASGGPCVEQTLRCLAPFGRLVVFGAASGKTATLSLAAIEHLLYAPVPNQSIVGFNVGGWFMERPQQAGAALGELIEDIMAERIRAPAIRSLTLAQAQEAHELLESRSSSGKLVIKPWLE